MGCLLEVLANCGNIYSQSTDSSNKRKTETTRKHHLTQGNDKRLYALAIFTTLQHWTIWQICQCVSELSQLAIWNQSTSYIRLQCQRYTCRTTSLENGSLLCQWWRTKCFFVIYWGWSEPNAREGRLEIYYDGTWGTVCNNGLNDVAAKVACNGLGFG